MYELNRLCFCGRIATEEEVHVIRNGVKICTPECEDFFDKQREQHQLQLQLVSPWGRPR